ncbi:hypothetical protein AAFC00_005597 [Neodothiora populina]|uniref:Ubiquitin smt3 n=1 Tax=Neodothiora populina TaxID=2781224 RepID=A0ABR3PLD2_9PEZI
MSQTRPKMDKATELAETIKTLSINTDPPKAVSASAKKAREEEERAGAEVSLADSWEEEAGADEADLVSTSTANGGSAAIAVPKASDVPFAPPPTPSSPTVYQERERFPSSLSNVPNRPKRSDSPSDDSGKRPEKSTAVANRLIAGALGVRAPKRTEEQRKYDRAIKEQEIRRKNKEKEDQKRREEEAAKAKAAIWED